MNKQFKKTLKEKLLIEGGKTLIVVVFLGLFSFFMIGHFKNVAAQSGPIIIGGGSPSNQERFEITTGKDAFAEFNPRGTDYNNDTRLSKIHIITDAVLYDEETNELTYNFVLSYYESDVPKDMKVTKILAEGKNIVLADIP